ncbi:SRPBCC domain-containing protein [Streptomyces sp. NBC_01764]|uniref:SRPBCC domain-containing protein n=1 Tax=Streptomyces sp. NBC_01764 TaxID=2975935 RepID=UPI00225B10D7|nr:SRPBCC domain-containing protein [Streptomyces sp. NBC_01764]MCX4404320.1 SRPBCC domain-containing protein [Streptomyces sp. NBC_01764]
MDNNPVITAVTDIAASPEEVWKVLTDFAAYAQWHPVLSFLDVPIDILTGTRLQAQVSTGTDNDGEYSFTVLHHEAPRRLAWEGGIPDILTGRHSFVLEPRDGGTRFTESEEFTGTAAAETIEAARSQLEENYASFGRALKERLISGH